MKKLSQKLRKLMRPVYLTFCAGAVSLIFVACYGSPPDWRHHECDCEICNTTIVTDEENGA